MIARRAAAFGLATILSLSVAPSPALELTRGPYLQMGSSDRVHVRWRTDEPVRGAVRFGAAPDQLDQTRAAALDTIDHEVVLDALAPDTRYFYEIGTTGGESLAGADSAHYFVTAPAPGTARPTRVWVAGDVGATSDSTNALKVASTEVRDAYHALNDLEGRHTDLWLLLGDNAYMSGTDEEFQKAVFDIYPRLLRTSVVWSALGNHEVKGGYPLPYEAMFTFPTDGSCGGVPSGSERYYAFDHGNIHFVVLDSEHLDSFADQVDWACADLAASSADWNIALWHHPPYSRGTKFADVDDELLATRTTFMSVIDSLGVDLVLTGHSHAYERSLQFAGHYLDTLTLDEQVIPFTTNPERGRIDENGPYLKPTLGPSPNQGCVQILTGSASKITTVVRILAFTSPVMVALEGDQRGIHDTGSVVIDVDGARLDARFVDDLGRVRDHFTMVKGIAEPSLSVTMNGTRFAPGDSADLHLDVDAGGLPDAGFAGRVLDLYVLLQPPQGAPRYLGPTGKLSSWPQPFLAGESVEVDERIVVFDGISVPSAPPGAYQWQCGFVFPGSPIPVGGELVTFDFEIEGKGASAVP